MEVGVGPHYYLAAHCMLYNYIQYLSPLNWTAVVKSFFFFFIPYSTNNANFYKR